jgi:hypothetical protein
VGTAIPPVGVHLLPVAPHRRHLVHDRPAKHPFGLQCGARAATPLVPAFDGRVQRHTRLSPILGRIPATLWPISVASARTALSSRLPSGAIGNVLLSTRCRGHRRAPADCARSPRTAAGARTDVRLADGLRTAGAPARVREPGPRSSPPRRGGVHHAFGSRAGPRLARSGEACLARRPDSPSRAALLERRLVD